MGAQVVLSGGSWHCSSTTQSPLQYFFFLLQQQLPGHTWWQQHAAQHLRALSCMQISLKDSVLIWGSPLPLIQLLCQCFSNIIVFLVGSYIPSFSALLQISSESPILGLPITAMPPLIFSGVLSEGKEEHAAMHLGPGPWWWRRLLLRGRMENRFS